MGFYQLFLPSLAVIIGWLVKCSYQSCGQIDNDNRLFFTKMEKKKYKMMISYVFVICQFSSWIDYNTASLVAVQVVAR